MEYSDEIIIECSVKQSKVGNGSSSWTNTIPTLILNEGDEIRMMGSWVGVKNSGESSIEIFDKDDATSSVVNASFKFSYYKTMDAKNVVAFPYHSTKITNRSNNLLGYGFTQELPNVAGVPTVEQYDNVPNIYSWGSPNNVEFNITEICKYDDILHEANSDQYSGNYNDWITNVELKQGIRDVVNTGNKYTLMYKKSNGRYDFVEREVQLQIPRGFYTPSSLATFITEEMNQVYFNGTINNLNETMSNNGRYFVGMTPTALPQLNITNGVGTNGAGEEIARGLGTQVGANEICYGIGLSKNITGNTILIEAQFINNDTYKSYRYTPQTAQDREDFDYMIKMVNEYCNIFAGWFVNTQQSGDGYAFHLYNGVYDGNGINQYIKIDASNPYDSGAITLAGDVYYFSTIQEGVDTTGQTDLSALLIGNAPPDYNNLTPLSAYGEAFPIGMPTYIGTKEKITLNGNDAYTCGKSAFNWFAYRNPTHPENNYLTDLEDAIQDYEHGNKYAGATNGNYNRWSLMNHEEPPSFEDPDDINLQPILRKYPNFMKYGMEMGVPLVSEDGIVLDENPIYPQPLDYDLTTLDPNNDLQNNIVVVEDALTINRIQVWYNFIQAQIDDGMIDITKGFAFAHFMVDTYETTLPDPPKTTIGSDESLRNRPRGMIIRINVETFINKTITDDYYWGFPNNEKMTIRLYSFVIEKYFTSIDGAITQGIRDYNFVEKSLFDTIPNIRINVNYETLKEVKDGNPNTTIVFGFGYSHLKSGWRNFTSMLCSYEMNTQSKTNIMFCGSNRMDSSQYDWGGVNYNNRIYIGARSPSLTYDTTSEKFYWNMFYTPQEAFNEHNQGVLSAQPALQPSVQEPFLNLMGQPAPNYSIDNEGNYSVSSDLNENEGQDIIQYNKEKNNLYNDALIILAPEITKHKTLLNDDIIMSGYISGNIFDYLFPTNVDYQQRFFCYDQDCRYNMFDGGYITNSHTTSAYVKNRPPADVKVNYLDVASGTNPSFLDTLVVSYGWGTFPTELGFIERKYEAGTIRPNTENIYDTMCGVQVYNWGDYGRTNWTSSLWDTLGFSLTDMMPTQYTYCNQIRNFTTNFLTPFTFNTSSFPMRTDGELLTSGFITITENIIGADNYTLQMPKRNFINQGGLLGVNSLSERIISFIGSNPIDKPNLDDLDNGTIIFQSPNGASLANNELIQNDFFISVDEADFGTKIYANTFPTKLDKPFFIVKCSLPDDNYKYLNNAEQLSVLPVVGVASKQYGNSDFYFSDDLTQLNFINRRKRVVNEVKVSICDNDGSLAGALNDNSTIFFKVIRRAIEEGEVVIPADPYVMEDMERIESILNAKQKKLYNEEINDYLEAGGI